MEDILNRESNSFVTFYMITNRVTNKPELLAHFTSFEDAGEIKEFVKQFETESTGYRSPTIH
tara:strand:+ start:162 stop:347 length:186 start_codon:yes stop_codon:yes gene_type:complete